MVRGLHKMNKGMILDPRTLQIDIITSPSWNPNSVGLEIDLLDASQVMHGDIHKDYNFVIATEVWEIPMRKTLKYLRSKGLKVFFVPREPFKTEILKATMFSYNKFLYENEYYFKPDLLLAPGEAYAAFWSSASPTVITGYPRFDSWHDLKLDRKEIKKDYGLEKDRRLIFFPSYPPLHYKRVGQEDTFVDLYDEQEATLKALEDFTVANSEYQAVIKVHPVAWKSHLKGKGIKGSVAGRMKKYLDHPTPSMKVIGDDRFSGLIAKELLFAADLVVGFTSTMLLEAGIIHRPSIHLLFGNTAELEGIPEYAKYLPTARTAEELSDCILASKTGIVPQDYIEYYLGPQDGKAGERILGEIKKYLEGK